MYHLKEDELFDALGKNVRQVFNPGFRIFSSLLTDSRQIKKDSIFVAIKGEHFDGHEFIKKSLENGAKAVISEKPMDRAHKNMLKRKKALFIHVSDSLKALAAIAGHNRMRSRARIISITGSNGKTTTKDFLSALLSTRFKTVASQASFNNHLGVPLTLLKISPDTEYAVVEMGMNHRGEILKLAVLAQPDVAVVTNIAESHMEFFKGKKDVAAAKAEIFKGLKPSGYAVINRDTPYYSYLKNKAMRRVVSCGKHRSARYRVTEVRDRKGEYSFLFGKRGKTKRYHLGIPGEHNLCNAVLAMTVCCEEGVTGQSVREGLSMIRLPKMRMEIHRYRDGITVINDAYNANPFSTDRAIDAFSRMEHGGRKIMVFADMLELGKKSREYHQKIGKKALKAGIDIFFCTGKNARYSSEEFNASARDGRRSCFIASKTALAERLSRVMKRGDAVLFKGSRGMRLENIIKIIWKNESKKQD